MIDYKDVMQEFHKWTIFYKTEKFPKAIKNFEITKYNNHKDFFVKFATIVNRNCGHIDHKLYIQSLAEFFKGWFHPRYLGHPKGTKIYKNYIELKKSRTKREDVEKEVLLALRFLLEYMLENNMKTLDEYLNEGTYTIPTIAKHFSAGSINMYFLTIIPDIKMFIKLLPTDIRNEYFKHFFDDYSLCRAKVINNITLRKLSDNLDRHIEKFINNNSNTNKKGDQ